MVAQCLGFPTLQCFFRNWKSIPTSSFTTLRTLGKYTSELLIILGITLSFLFDGWRQDREDRRAEREYLMALRNDLRIDSAVLAYNPGGEEVFLCATERLATFQHPEEILDSLHILIDAATSYAAFSPAAATSEVVAPSRPHLAAAR